MDPGGKIQAIELGEQHRMLRAKQRNTTTVVVDQVSSVELTKRGSSNSLNVQVRCGDELLGNLVMGRGSVQWWPGGNKTNALRKPWPAFVKILEKAMSKK